MNALAEYTRTAPAGITFVPLSPQIGVAVDGIDLTGNLDGKTVRLLQDALLKHKVLVFHGQAFSPAGQRDFAGTIRRAACQSDFSQSPGLSGDHGAARRSGPSAGTSGLAHGRHVHSDAAARFDLALRRVSASRRRHHLGEQRSGVRISVEARSAAAGWPDRRARLSQAVSR